MSNKTFEWREVVPGLLRCAAGECSTYQKFAYEIIVLTEKTDFPIEEAYANLYICIEDMEEHFFTRELLCANRTVKECFDKAAQDYDENIMEV